MFFEWMISSTAITASLEVNIPLRALEEIFDNDSFSFSEKLITGKLLT